MRTPVREIRASMAPRIATKIQDAAAVAGMRLVHLHRWRVLPKPIGDRR